MTVTVRYANGVAAVFASHEEALAQAAHDNSFPGHVDAAFIVDGDHSETHADWGHEAPQDVTVLTGREETTALSCDCTECTWQQVAPDTHPFEREHARSRLVARERFGGDA